jgi:hypothetical protein
MMRLGFTDFILCLQPTEAPINFRRIFLSKDTFDAFDQRTSPNKL